ncbi:hypothetical protein M8C21_025580 [Ambrosia artemisiifolia]|uniref:Uncharacterized protein n=1 Tax=Ambrosia artemisiifolia TaxID=4212 RepID=A0AAD5GH29_AMBAR|nr:hypothetical protein M8C21_025580 [Ambrosia artemisiifolia]
MTFFLNRQTYSLLKFIQFSSKEKLTTGVGANLDLRPTGVGANQNLGLAELGVKECSGCEHSGRPSKRNKSSSKVIHNKPLAKCY